MSNWLSVSDLERLQKLGKIRGFVAAKAEQPYGRKVAKHFKRGDKAKDWIALNLLYWCNERALTLEEEYRFHPERKYRFDWCIPVLKIAVEYEGLMSEKSRHTTIKGFSRDTQKYNEAARLGWTVLRYTMITYKNLLNDLNKIQP